MYMYNCGICTLSLWVCISMATTGGCQGDSGDVFSVFLLVMRKFTIMTCTFTLPPSLPLQYKQTYVRSLIEERLDTLIPISHQPRDLIHQIIMDTNSRFPEFSSSVRKRIRTYLKSYRRSKRVKDMQAAAAIGHQYNSSTTTGNGSSNTASLSNGMVTAKVNTTKVLSSFVYLLYCVSFWLFLSLSLSLSFSLSPSFSLSFSLPLSLSLSSSFINGH